MKDDTIFQSGGSDSGALPGRAKPSHRILVVDDDPDIRQICTQALSSSGYHVDAAEDGAAAWNNLQRNRYDLLVTDNEMPRVTGLQLLKKVHAARLDLPVIMATGILPRDEFTSQPWLKPHAALIKPYTLDELLYSVRSVLSAAVRPARQLELLPADPSDGNLNLL